MRKVKQAGWDPSLAAILTLAALFFVATVWCSYARWADFSYRTFDLAYYTQAIWQFLHGRFEVTIEPVPLLGNHVEPIVFLIAPLFAIFRHPMTLVVVQNAALAAMGPVGFDICNRLGLKRKESALLASALLLAPALGFTALHEFHPEALAAPLLLLLFRARLVPSLTQHWLWFIAVLACKENMAPLLAGYCAVHLILQRKKGLAELANWYVWPMVAAIVWFLICTLLITPALNAGQIDYLGLYSQIGNSAGDILAKAFTQPQLIGKALWQSLTHGNLVWALLFPFLCLPLLRPHWLVMATPILLQHLLSWRSSEWNVYFHYAAPLLPFFWIATAEAVARLQNWRGVPAKLGNSIPLLLLLGCLVGQSYFGPAGEMTSATTDWLSHGSDRIRRSAFLSKIPDEASVVAPLPYLSHLALREKVYSLHFILKGLKTLSRAAYEPPPPPDFVLIDYGDSSTFDASSGYYHPTMKMTDGRIIPSSDQRLHSFLETRSWVSHSVDELTLLEQRKKSPSVATFLPATAGCLAEAGPGNYLVAITKSGDAASADGSLEIKTAWNFKAPRQIFPWMFVRLTNQTDGKHIILTRGLCAPEASVGPCEENWHITSLGELPGGNYSIEAIFVDNTKRVWQEVTGKGDPASTLLSPPIPLGHIKIPKRNSNAR